ncbi:type II toxin-antitoxin system HicB family antitoxin [Bifidobacterium choerinum]|uniref:Antitoxin HicB n=1 Tax=Bifidobacterium choerinum TaxID=35760 RepID=A0A087AFR9_9BIFI|nr:type II toxin-antitoxin system HicB family antitoxin [Bifidobacterium choerinum]KFI57619.1 antitoxin HicB [Bifidobacterium choerinum]
MKLTYPVILEPYEEDGGGYVATVPDMPGLVTYGSSLSETMEMVQDAACGWVLTELEDGRPAPRATALMDVDTEDVNAQKALILLDMDAYAEKYGRRAVRKNVTIPAWLDTWASRRNLNYSHTLRDALESEYRQQTMA